MTDPAPETPKDATARRSPGDGGGADAPLLALDAGSPVVSVAVGRGGRALAERSIPLRRSSENLLRMIDEALEEADLRLGDLAGVVALAGPGSFTGLRVGLATTLGLHQALDLPAAALPTLPVAATWAGGRQEVRWPVAAVVDALRGEWFVQLFDAPASGPPRPRAEPAILAPAALAAAGPATVVGFGAARATAALAAAAPSFEPAAVALEPPALAAAALAFARAEPPAWDPGGLVQPLYLRAPAVTPPRRPPAAPAAAGADAAG